MRQDLKCRVLSQGGGTIDNLQNYFLGLSRGRSRLLSRLLRSLHIHLYGYWLGAALELSVFPSKVGAVCLWIPLLFLVILPTGDYWFGLGQRIDKQKTCGIGLSMPGTPARICREPCKVSNRFAAAPISPNTELTSHYPFSSHQLNFQQIWDRWTASEGAPHFQERRCSVETGQYRLARSLVSIWQTSCGRQQKACNGGGWEKRGQEKSENDARKDWAAEPEKKNWRLKQTKTERVGAYIGSPVRWNEGRSRKRSVIFSYFESCCDHELLLIWKKRWFTVKEAFLLTITWLVCNMTRLHRSSCQCRYWFNWLDDDAPCTPKTGNTAQRWLDLFVFAAF